MTDENYTASLLAITPEKQREYDRLAEARYARYSATLRKRQFRLLEVGCGSCGLAPRFQQLGVDYHGIDLDGRVVEAARAAGVVNVRQADFLDEPAGEPFDVIAFSQVLEHIVSPRQFLAKVHTCLRPGGVVHCDVPNHASLPSLIYRLPVSSLRWGAITYPHHLFAHTRRSLQASFAPLFSVDVFAATVDDPVWGQAARRDSTLARMGPLLRTLHAGSLLVAYGTRPVFAQGGPFA